MKIRTIAIVGLLLAMAVTLSETLITRNGVGPLEYVTGILLVVALLGLALRMSLRALQRG